MVFYRKYRPQTIEELDSREVRDKLYSVLRSSSVSHAFLFTGSKGLGKTSTARIVAKVLNCERLAPSKLASSSKEKKLNAKRYTLNAGVEPCNKCEQCISITNGTNLDVLEIDGASNRGIDEIRDLREKIKLSPLAAYKKVYIIDEVHMLTTEAFNALLKTLEEPPDHAVFILCTTESHKVPPTISSRCLEIQFKKATQEELVRSFKRIIKAEKLTADDETLSLIAKFSDGSFRDGVKILEEIAHSASSGQVKDKKITKDLIEKTYQVSNIKYQVSEMISLLKDRKTKEALKLVSQLVEQGVDMKYFIEQMIDELHLALLSEFGVGEERVGDARPPATSSEQVNTRQAGVAGEVGQGGWKVEEIKKLIELLGKAHGELKYAVLPQIPLELAIVEWGIQKTQIPTQLSQNTQIVRKPENQIVRNSDGLKNRSFDSPSFPSIPKITQQDISKYSENDALWTALIDKVKAYNHSIAGVLRGCRIKSYDGKNLIIETNFKFHKDKLSEPKSREILVKTVRDVVKKDVTIEVVLKNR